MNVPHGPGRFIKVDKNGALVAVVSYFQGGLSVRQTVVFYLLIIYLIP